MEKPMSLLEKCKKRFPKDQHNKDAYIQWSEVIKKTQERNIKEITFVECDRHRSVQVNFRECFNHYLAFILQKRY